jgi:uncharacterized protein
MKTVFTLLIRGYQLFISPMLPRSCRYYPSCSQYGLEAVREYGATRGAVLAGWRILRCNPFSLGGYDPVHNQTLFAPRPPGGRTPATDDPATPPRSSGEERSETPRADPAPGPETPTADVGGPHGGCSCAQDDRGHRPTSGPGAESGPAKAQAESPRAEPEAEAAADRDVAA